MKKIIFHVLTIISLLIGVGSTPALAANRGDILLQGSSYFNTQIAHSGITDGALLDQHYRTLNYFLTASENGTVFNQVSDAQKTYPSGIQGLIAESADLQLTLAALDKPGTIAHDFYIQERSGTEGQQLLDNAHYALNHRQNDIKKAVQELSKTDPTAAAQWSGAMTKFDNTAANNIVNSNLQKIQQAESLTCFSVFNGGLNVKNCILMVGMEIGATLTYFGGKLVWLANTIFNYSFDLSVRQFEKLAANSEVHAAWSIIRGLINIFLIFLLLWAAIGLILDLKQVEVKRLVTQVIITGLLVNFSFFFTNYIILGSNVLANQFYSLAAGNHVDTVSNTPDLAGLFTKLALSTTPRTAAPDLATLLAAFAHFILTIIATIVLLAGALMMIVRLIKLLLVLIFSPVALLLPAVPIKKAREYGERWWSALWQQAFFAPIFLFMIFVSMRIAVLGTSVFGSLAGPGGKPDLSNFESGSTAGAIIYAIIVNGLMIASILVAQSMSAYGAGGAIGALRRVQGWFGRNSVGAIASGTKTTLDKAGQQLGKTAAGRGILYGLNKLGGAEVYKGIKYGAEGAKFGGTMTRKESNEDWKARIDTNLERYKKDSDGLASAMKSYKTEGARNYAWSKLTSQQRVALKGKLSEKLVSQLNAKLFEDNKKKGAEETKKYLAAEREEEARVNLSKFEDAMKKLNDAGTDATKIADAQKEVLEAAGKLNKNQLKTDLSVEQVIKVAGMNGWSADQLGAITDNRGRQDLNSSQLETLKTARTTAETKEREMSRVQNLFKTTLNSATPDTAAIEELLRNLASLPTATTAAPVITNDLLVRKLTSNIAAELLKNKVVNTADQKRIKTAVETIVGSDPAAPANLRELNTWFTTHPIGRTWGEEPEKK